MVRYSVLSALALCLSSAFGSGPVEPEDLLQKRQGSSKPNVLVIMSDDQDLLMDSLSVMPNVRSLIGDKGVTYDKHYCTVAWCCPSRVNYFTGRAAHNTNVTAIAPPYGGWQKFTEVGLNENYLPVWLQNSGVDTYYIGKLMNGFNEYNLATPAPPKGWTNSSFLVDPWMYDYYDSHWTTVVNASTADIAAFPGIHTTEVTRQKALAMLDEAAAKGGQFYMQVAPVAPHKQLVANLTQLPPIPKEYRGTFNNRTVPRTSNFNPDVPSGASWVYNLPQLTPELVTYGDTMYYHRLANVAYIDDMVGSLISKLEEHDMLDNTYVIYTTDNGYHISQHRLVPGKRCPYEEDVNIPLLIRGPDVAVGATSSVLHSHTDMAPTILNMLGLPIEDSYAFDGAIMAYNASEIGVEERTELVNIEFWTSTLGGATTGSDAYYNNTYKALRVIDDDYSFLYTTWCTGEREFYDMITDPGQMNNLLLHLFTNQTSTGTFNNQTSSAATSYYGRPFHQLWIRLDALLIVTKSCKEDTCRNPWSVIFPQGNVQDLRTAMGQEYDAFFAKQPLVSFSYCAIYYDPADEGPLHVIPYDGSSQHVLALPKTTDLATTTSLSARALTKHSHHHNHIHNHIHKIKI